LNPAVPWKTRGNAALGLRIHVPENKMKAVIEEVLKMVETESDLACPRTDPGVVCFSGNDIPSEIGDFAQRTIHDVVKKSEALKLIKRFKVEAIGFNSGRGIVGALAGGYLCGKMSARKMLSFVIIGSIATLTILSVLSEIAVLSLFYESKPSLL
jgi:tRNA(Ile2) C34 agmatinyltransferase TiaS